MTEQLCCYCSFAVVNLSFPILEIKSSTDIAGDDDDDDDSGLVWFGSFVAKVTDVILPFWNALCYVHIYNGKKPTTIIRAHVVKNNA